MNDRAIVSRAAWTRTPMRHLESLPRLGRLALLGLCSGWVAGCALSLPMGGGDEAPTGSIKRINPSPFSAEMDVEDWRRAKSALDTALDPQGNGASVGWDNPKSGAKGSFIPLASPYPKDDGICRPFKASLAFKDAPERVVQSSACRVNSGDWIVGRIVTLSSGGLPKSTRNLVDRVGSPQIK